MASASSCTTGQTISALPPLASDSSLQMRTSAMPFQFSVGVCTTVPRAPAISV